MGREVAEPQELTRAVRTTEFYPSFLESCGKRKKIEKACCADWIGGPLPNYRPKGLHQLGKWSKERIVPAQFIKLGSVSA
jgi:hypothetical protein